ncbi:MAG: ATP-binding protein [Myxococcota bacterium]|jgi:hypothetical protein|nr:ATP-binding protein [Myxococcota bacterium]
MHPHFPRFFNTAGPCRPEEHYMLPPEQRVLDIRGLIDSAAYFVIHAPRQSGKTTLLRNLSRQLTQEGRYAAITISLEVFIGNDVATMWPQFPSKCQHDALRQWPSELQAPPSEALGAEPHVGLTQYLSTWASLCPRPLVIFFDEVDALQGEVLISLLRQLRDGYCSRPAPFPYSVALVGMRDVRDYRGQVRDEGGSIGSASPFNIKSESLRLSNFDADEVRALLEQHTEATGQRFDADAATEIFEQTQGQPWLCNALAHLLCTHRAPLVPDRSQNVTRQHVLEAREILIERRDTHLDSLVARLREDRVRRIIEPILTGELKLDSATSDDDFSYVRDLGLVRLDKGQRVIANPIYQEIIPRVLTYQLQSSIPLEPAWYIAEDGTLDLMKLLEGFVQFWHRNGEVLLRGMPYQEAAPHLVLMAYLQRVVNGGGHILREFAVGTGRADLVISFGGRDDVLELKLLRDKYTLEDGKQQVARYAKRLGRDHGYLVIFDNRVGSPWEERGRFEQHQHDGVELTVLWA